METDNIDVAASFPSLLVSDAMTFNVTSNMPTSVSVRYQGKFQQPAMYI